MTAPRTIRIGLAQINPTVGDFDGNEKKILQFFREGEQRGLDLVIFPELAVSGYPVWDLANKKSFVEENLKVLKRIGRACASSHAALATGFIDFGKTKNGRNRNALAIIHKGKVWLTQAKTLLPTYDVFLEEIFFEPADSQQLFSFKGTKIGGTICEDIWDDDYKVKPVRTLKKRGASVVINISASPYHREAPRLRNRIVSSRAKENGVWIVYVNQVGAQDDLVFDGRCLVADPKGRIVLRGPAFEEALLEIEIPIRGAKKPLPTIPLAPSDEVADIYRALVLGIRDYARKNGFQKVVVGLSGGIDSALVATLACDALGSGAVIGVTMPGAYSSAGSYEDSERLAKNLGIEFRKQPITPLFERFLEQVAEQKKWRHESLERLTLANENLQARLRALELMYISNDERCLLLSTGNKSELAMGYCTLYGDMCGGLAVLGDVYKTDVYKLSRYRNRLSHCIPEAILEKPPSAELRPNQKDEDSLPPYDVLDQILKLYIEENLDESEIARRLAKSSVPGKMIAETIKRVEHNEYKRRQTPPLIRVTEKAWFGRRMPITNHFFHS